MQDLDQLFYLLLNFFYPPRVVTMLVAFTLSSLLMVLTFSYVGVPVIRESIGIGKVSMYFLTVVTLGVAILAVLWLQPR